MFTSLKKASSTTYQLAFATERLLMKKRWTSLLKQAIYSTLSWPFALQVVVGNDCGMLAMYSVSIGESTSSEKEDTFTESCRDSKHLSFYNNVCCVDHDRSILSLSVSQDNRKIVTGSMDHK